MVIFSIERLHFNAGIYKKKVGGKAAHVIMSISYQSFTNLYYRFLTKLLSMAFSQLGPRSLSSASLFST